MYMSRRDRIAMSCHILSYPTLAYIFDSSTSMLYLLCSQVATIAPSFSLFMIPVNKQSLFPAWTILKTPPKTRSKPSQHKVPPISHTNRYCQKKGKKKAEKNKTKRKARKRQEKGKTKKKKNSPDTPQPPPPPPTRVSHTYKPNSSWSP